MFKKIKEKYQDESITMINLMENEPPWDPSYPDLVYKESSMIILWDKLSLFP